jgi:hypothetical protein
MACERMSSARPAWGVMRRRRLKHALMSEMTGAVTGIAKLVVVVAAMFLILTLLFDTKSQFVK